MNAAAGFLVALLVLLPAATGAEAQGVFPTALEVIVTPVQEALPPDGTPVETPLIVRYSVQQPGPLLGPTRVDISAGSDSPWLLAGTSPTTIYFAPPSEPCACATYTMAAEASLIVAATPDAPAFTPSTIRITASAAPNGLLQGSSAETLTVAQADFFALTTAQPRDSVVALRPGSQGPLTVSVTNHGNGQVLVTFETETAPDGVRAAAPAPIVLEAAQAGGTKTREDVTWYFEAGQAFEPGFASLIVRTQYRFDSTLKGEDVRLRVAVVDGTRAHDLETASHDDAPEPMETNTIPGPSTAALPAGAALAAVALALARRGLSRR